MARTISTIKAQIIAEKTAQSTLTGLTSTSSVAVYNLWAFICAVAINLHEQLIDIFKAETETKIASANVPNVLWLQRKVLEFQYSATVPQIIELIDLVPTYPVIDTALRIITRCSVKTTAQRIVTVKVAKDEPPVALTSPELAALTGYLVQGGDGTVLGSGTGISYAGVQIKPISINADRLYLKGVINYNGQYASTIQAAVIAAIESYLATIPFDGNVKVLELTDAIQQVVGVTDIFIEDFAMRADATVFANKTFLIQSFTQILTLYPTFAGYIVQEDESGQTFADQLTFAAS